MAYYASIPTYIPPVVFSNDSYDFPAYQPGTSQLERSRSNRYVYEDDPWNSARASGVLVPNPPLVIRRGKRGSKAPAEKKPKQLQFDIPDALKPGVQPTRETNAKLSRRLTFITNSTGSSSGRGSTIEDIRATVDKTALFARLQLHLGDRSATLTVVSDQHKADNARNPSPRPRGASDPPVASNRHSTFEPTKPHWAPTANVAQLEPESVQRPLPPASSGNVWQDMNAALSMGSGRRRPTSEQFRPRQPAYPSIASRLEPSVGRASFDGASFDRPLAQLPKERDMDVEDDFVLVEAHWKGPTQKRDATPPRGPKATTPTNLIATRRPRSLTPQSRAAADYATPPLRPKARRPATEPIIPAQFSENPEPPVLLVQSSTPPFPVLRLNDAPVDPPTPSMPEIDSVEDMRPRSASPPAETVFSHLSFGNLPEIPGSEDTHWHSAPGSKAPKPDSRVVDDVYGASDAIEAQIQNLYGELLGDTVVDDENGEIGRRVAEDSRNATALILKALREQTAEDEAEERSRAGGWRNGLRFMRRATTDA